VTWPSELSVNPRLAKLLGPAVTSVNVKYLLGTVGHNGGRIGHDRCGRRECARNHVQYTVLNVVYPKWCRDARGCYWCARSCCERENAVRTRSGECCQPERPIGPESDADWSIGRGGGGDGSAYRKLRRVHQGCFERHQLMAAVLACHPHRLAIRRNPNSCGSRARRFQGRQVNRGEKRFEGSAVRIGVNNLQSTLGIAVCLGDESVEAIRGNINKAGRTAGAEPKGIQPSEFGEWQREYSGECFRYSAPHRRYKSRPLLP